MKHPFEIVFNDEYLAVINKIAKIIVQPSPKKEKHTLTTLLGSPLGEPVFPCHRLDRETSGLIIYAKSRRVQEDIFTQFRRSAVEKKYLAFIRGGLNPKRGFFEGMILDSQGRRFGEKPKLAKTSYRCLEKFDSFSLVELKPLTGRTNQLRIQLAQARHPILGERKYAFGRDFPVNFRRLALHAYFLRFTHPVSRDMINIEIKLASDMDDFLTKHGR